MNYVIISVSSAGQVCSPQFWRKERGSQGQAFAIGHLPTHGNWTMTTLSWRSRLALRNVCQKQERGFRADPVLRLIARLIPKWCYIWADPHNMIFPLCITQGFLFQLQSCNLIKSGCSYVQEAPSSSEFRIQATATEMRLRTGLTLKEQDCELCCNQHWL